MSLYKQLDGRALIAMIALCAIWGTQQVAIKLAALDMAPMLQVGLRSEVAFIIVYALVLARGERGFFGGGRWLPGLAVGGLFGLEFILFAEGLRYTDGSRMVVFLYTAPIFAALGLHATSTQERLAPLQWLGVIIAFGGIGIAFSQGWTRQGAQAWIGDILGLAAGFAWGATTIAVRATRLGQTPAAVTLCYQLAGAGLLATGTAIASGQTAISLTPVLAASLIYQTIIISVVTYLAWFILLRRYLASRLGILSLMTPLFGIGFGVVILDEPLTPSFMIGVAVILTGIFLVNGSGAFRRGKRAPRDDFDKNKLEREPA